MPRVSIIVPIYNVEEYIDNCIHSLITQTLKDIEIILVDDGSLDQSPQICDKHAKLDKRIVVIHKKNGGLGYARNSGLDVATGDYVAFVDSDDFVDCTMFETMYNKAQKENSDIVYCNHHIYYSKSGQIANPPRPFDDDVTFKNNDVIDEVLKNMIASSPKTPTDRKYYMSVWRGIFKRNIVSDLRFFSEREILSEDILYQAEALQRASSVSIIKDRLYYYRENAMSLTHKYRKDRIEKSIILYESLKDTLSNIIKKRDSNEWNERLLKFLYGYFKFSMYSNIKAMPHAKLGQLQKDFITCSNYLDCVSFYKVYPINRIPRKQRLILFLFRHKLFSLFYILTKAVK